MPAVLSGLLLTCSFPNIGISWFAWFALVPLLICLRDLPPKQSFYLGFLTGFIHYLTLAYWLAYTMRTYGHLPAYLCVVILFALSAYLALYVAVFSAAVAGLRKKPLTCLFIISFLWVCLEYIRSFLFTGFPWEFIGHSQFRSLNIIQISDILGVYGISFLIVLSNTTIFLVFLCLTQKKRQGRKISKSIAAGSIFIFIIIFCFYWLYGKRQIKSVDELSKSAGSAHVTIVQGNIDQSKKWDPRFQAETTIKYINLSLSAKDHHSDLIIWPETATPFYLIYNTELTQPVQKAVQDIGTYFLIGSPSFIQVNGNIEYYNSAYLIDQEGNVRDKYDKVHLVPFGEYVPFNKWLPFLGKIVAQVGDFRSGIKGDTIQWGGNKLGVQICFEIIFPNLSRAMVKNGALLLVSITNDAWFGKTGAPYQHFSMSVFRTVENRRAFVRSANTGISGFVDPVGRIIAKTDLFQEAVMTRFVPLLDKITFYTRFGDIFAKLCLVIILINILQTIRISNKEV